MLRSCYDRTCELRCAYYLRIFEVRRSCFLWLNCENYTEQQKKRIMVFWVYLCYYCVYSFKIWHTGRKYAWLLLEKLWVDFRQENRLWGHLFLTRVCPKSPGKDLSIMLITGRRHRSWKISHTTWIVARDFQGSSEWFNDMQSYN